MTKSQLFIGQIAAFITGVALFVAGLVTKNGAMTGFGSTIAIGALAAFGIPRPADK